MTVRSQVICIGEDRRSCEHALKLLLISLSRHNAGTPVVVFYPPADQEFIDWAKTLDLENISVRRTWPRGASGWNVKPHMMLALLDEGYREIFWIDSDVLVTGNVPAAIGRLPGDILVAAEECLQIPASSRAELVPELVFEAFHGLRSDSHSADLLTGQ